MKPNRTKLFIAITSVALILVLAIQVNWILRTAKIKEELFNEKANMVLARTSEALSADEETCRKIETGMSQSEIHKIDSLFAHYMNFYNIQIDYSYELIKPDLFSKYGTGFRNNVFNKRLDEVVSKNGLELKLFFPDKKKYILAEMGTMFTTSVVLIIVVLVMFWHTILSLHREKKISEQTTEFLNNMTHEFKTPLTNIALAGKMILKDPSLTQGDKINHYSGIILEENEKLRQQVEHMLSMTALERGEIPIQKTKIDLHQLLQDSLKCINVQIEHKQGEIKTDLKAESHYITGDPVHLMNAICNLIDNAIKYSGDAPDIKIETSDSGQNIVVEISDNGIGIDKQYQKKVFDIYFRVPTGNLHDVKGFGIGLAYTKKIVELHGGTIQLSSELGKGTTFKLVFPNA